MYKLNISLKCKEVLLMDVNSNGYNKLLKLYIYFMDTLYIFINDKYLVSSVLKGILFSEAEPDSNILFFFKYNHHHHLTIEKQFRIKMAAMIFVCTSVMEYVIIHWFFSLEEKSLNEGRFVYFYKRQQCCNPHHLSSVATRSVLLNAINIIHIISVKSLRSRQSMCCYLPSEAGLWHGIRYRVLSDDRIHYLWSTGTTYWILP